jgi:hypothetical protein
MAAGTMSNNMERYKRDLSGLIARGDQLAIAIEYACKPEKMRGAWELEFAREISADKTCEKLDPESAKKLAGAAVAQKLVSLPDFDGTYQTWYSEAKALIKQILPDRLADFVRHYEKPKRSEISMENYVIEDFLQGLQATLRGSVVVSRDAAISRFMQQLAIVKAAKARFESSLFDIRHLVQADLLDSELEAASELSKRGFYRAGGAVAGVVLERHLAQVCENHNVTIKKAKPTIVDFNDALKAADVVEVPQWRFVQHLGDIRNICDHDKKVEPTAEQVGDLIAGVGKISKTLF